MMCNVFGGLILSGLIASAIDTARAPNNTQCDVSSQLVRNPYQYAFPRIQAENTTGFLPMQPCGNFTLEEASIDGMQHAMSSGLLTSVQLTMCYLRRTYQVNPYANCMLEQNPDVLDIARAMDAERQAGIVRGPLHGIPFLVKDNIASKDNMQTTAGSWALLGSVVPRDAFVVHGLRRAGAVLLGKATLSEWADMRSNNYSEGYSGRGGQARSPYNLTVNPGGSSSGSAGAVAANAIAFALGTETDGSVINPAERNAVVGIKPTVGLTSRAGVIPESTHQDTVGTFGRTVRDATYALDAIYGIDSRDNYTSGQLGQTPTGGYAQYLTNSQSLVNASFGIPWDTFWIYANAPQQETLLKLVEAISAAGATIVNHTELPSRKLVVDPEGWNWDYGSARGYPNESEYTVVKVDFYNNIRDYLSELNNTNIRSLEDIVAYNNANDGTEGGYPYPLGIPAFYSGQDGFLASLASKGEINETYYQALRFCHYETRENGIDAALGLNSLGGYASRPVDALLVPPDVAQTYQVAAQAGYPMITIPAGEHPTEGGGTGMPFGLALMGTAWSEVTLVKWASAIEDLQLRDKSLPQRSLPKWLGANTRNVPLLNVS